MINWLITKRLDNGLYAIVDNNDNVMYSHKKHGKVATAMEVLNTLVATGYTITKKNDA